MMALLLHNMLLWFLSFSYVTRTSSSLDTLAVNQSIRDDQRLVSASGIIEAGFFSPGNSTQRKYLGVWYRNMSPLTVVWVANREAPLHNSSGVLKLNQNGTLLLLDSANNRTLWSSNISTAGNNIPVVAQLLDSGNLVVKNVDKGSFLWQSFDYPGDTLVPGMKLGWNLETGLERYVSSWKSSDDPAKGEYAQRIDLRGYPQLFTFKGSHIIYGTGQWNGEAFRGYLSPDPRINRTFVVNEKEVYYEFELLDRSATAAYRLLPSGDGEILSWTIGSSNSRQVATEGGLDVCDRYAYCGANSICSADGYLATCECLKGYIPKFPQQWSVQNWTDGCVPRNKSTCKNSYADGFWPYTYSKLPDTSSSWFNKTMNLEECKVSCRRNCSCVAYANLYVNNGGSGCLLWFHNMVDVRKFSQRGQDLFVRVPPSELDQDTTNGHRNIKKKIAGITVGVIIFGLMACISTLIIKNPGAARKIYNKHYKNNSRKEDVDLPIFKLSVLANATENFSSSHKLGEGGFGPVYKGILIDGQEIAVKRLSKKSEQGLEEFKTEVALIAKLQHRNLVKLLGCYVKGEEKMLIYEYMSNKSLDYFVFDETKRMSLDWLKRFNIIGGIARGLLYLHQDSRLRIIHRDLKTSNILLDAHFNSKISDFGLARILLGDQIEANTSRVAGTYGYMPPEYAEHGHFSVKSDVFSYGVIVLEILSGKKNRGFSDPKHDHNLLGHAWRLWTEERALELLDKVIREQCTPFEVMRCIQVGLLCVQQRPEDRPDMSSVVLMLNGEKLLPRPKVPGFYIEKDVGPKSHSSSANEISITEFGAR